MCYINKVGLDWLPVSGLYALPMFVKAFSYTKVCLSGYGPIFLKRSLRVDSVAENATLVGVSGDTHSDHSQFHFLAFVQK